MITEILLDTEFLRLIASGFDGQRIVAAMIVVHHGAPVRPDECAFTGKPPEVRAQRNRRNVKVFDEFFHGRTPLLLDKLQDGAPAFIRQHLRFFSPHQFLVYSTRLLSGR
jgi:hypothetical protein